MEFVQMKCPSCGANLEVENGLDSFYCKYCGTKIILSGQSSAAYVAKTASQIANRLLDQREAAREEKRREEEENRKAAMKFLIGLTIFIVAAFAIAIALALYLT